jgi:hypothetical protein
MRDAIEKKSRSYCHLKIAESGTRRQGKAHINKPESDKLFLGDRK